MKSVGYIRVSTEEQAREGVSLENQKKKIETYCDLYGLELTEIIVDAGQSAKSVNRDGMQRLLKLTSKRKPEIMGIVVYKLCRIFRSCQDALFFSSEWDRKGIALHSVQEQLDTKSAMGKFFFTILSAINELDRNVTAERTVDSLSFKRQNGEKTGGSVPFGFDIGGHRTVIKDGKEKRIPVLSPNKEEQKIIKSIFKMAEQGCSLQAICDELESRGVKTKAGKDKWQPKTVSRILKRRS